MDIRRLLLVFVLFASFLIGCAATRDRDPAPDSPDSPDSPDGGSAVIVGCRQEPLVLGEVSDAELAAPQAVWTGTDFAVGWSSADGYHVVITNGRSISNSVDLAAMPVGSAQRAQLLWSGGRLELYYGLSESIFVDAFDAQLKVAQTRMIGFGSFVAIPMAADRVAVLTRTALFLDGTEIALANTSAGAGGWNGSDFLLSGVLGHGQWSLEGLAADGMRKPPAIELNWCGACNTSGSAAGSVFASSAEAGRHAVAIAAQQSLTVAIEGRPVVERELLAESSDVAMLWDGGRYVVLLADQLTAGDGVGRDIVLLTSATGAWDDVEPFPVSQHASDERFPVGAVAAPADYGIAWIRGSELVFQRCALTERPTAR